MEKVDFQGLFLKRLEQDPERQEEKIAKLKAQIVGHLLPFSRSSMTKCERLQVQPVAPFIFVLEKRRKFDGAEFHVGDKWLHL